MLTKQYTDIQITHIREQAFAYQCACPAQVCVAIDALRGLHEYQMNCLDATDVDREVHLRISSAAEKSHWELEQCLSDVLRLEGWDLETLKMPEHLRKRLLSGS